MRKADFKRLANRLIQSGIAPRHANRAASELRDHYADLVDAAVDNGLTDHAARQQAAQQLGSMDDFVAAMQAQRELKTWAFRYPNAARVVYPIACLVALPAYPVVAGVAHRAALARWGACLLSAGLVTISILFVLQVSILQG